jgi:SAM-dependent methyltransferase
LTITPGLTALYDAHNFWRVYSDAVSGQWLAARVSGGDRALKTDMFDEVWTPGLAPLLAGSYRRVTGIDISGDVLQLSRRNAGALLTQADVRSLPFARESFDCVLSPSTLDHFASEEHIASSVAELHRVLRRGGLLLLLLDNPVNPMVWLRNALPFHLVRGVAPYEVGVTCTPARLGEILRTAGFRVVEMTATVHCPRALVVQLARVVGERMRRRLLDTALKFERCGGWPTRFLTGHFTAVHAVKESGG